MSRRAVTLRGGRPSAFPAAALGPSPICYGRNLMPEMPRWSMMEAQPFGGRCSRVVPVVAARGGAEGCAGPARAGWCAVLAVGRAVTPPAWYRAGDGPPQPGHGDHGASMLASHADRERAVDVLRAGFGEGRMEQNEFEKRVGGPTRPVRWASWPFWWPTCPRGPYRSRRPYGRATDVSARSRAEDEREGGRLGDLRWAVPGDRRAHRHSRGGSRAFGACSEIRRTGEGGDGLALTGLVLGWLSTAGWTLVVTLLLIAAADDRMKITDGVGAWHGPLGRC